MPHHQSSTTTTTDNDTDLPTPVLNLLCNIILIFFVIQASSFNDSLRLKVHRVSISLCMFRI